jgi:uncharacterized membrane-anchored protein YitT (DUF2179 family)
MFTAFTIILIIGLVFSFISDRMRKNKEYLFRKKKEEIQLKKIEKE